MVLESVIGEHNNEKIQITILPRKEISTILGLQSKVHVVIQFIYY